VRAGEADASENAADHPERSNANPSSVASTTTRALRELAEERLAGEGVLDLALDAAVRRSRAELVLVALRRETIAGRVRQLDLRGPDKQAPYSARAWTITRHVKP
jgi:hypothetical protein